MTTHEKALTEISEIVLKYDKENGNSPAANHCRNIALEALAQPNKNVKDDGKDKRIEELENGFRLLQTYQLSPTLERIIEKTLNKL